jgi:hypothetical protein
MLRYGKASSGSVLYGPPSVSSPRPLFCTLTGEHLRSRSRVTDYCARHQSRTSPSHQRGSAGARDIASGSKTSSFTCFATHTGRKTCVRTNLAHSRYILTERKVCDGKLPAWEGGVLATASPRPQPIAAADTDVHGRSGQTIQRAFLSQVRCFRNIRECACGWPLGVEHPSKPLVNRPILVRMYGRQVESLQRWPVLPSSTDPNS